MIICREDRGPLARDPSVRRLSDRERETALLVADGLTDGEIARAMGVRPSTVRIYVRRVQMRLHLSGRDDVIAWVTARHDPNRPEQGLVRATSERRHTPLDSDDEYGDVPVS